jgi:hypothetical protein
MMSKKKCDYCEATTYKSLAEAGWLWIELSVKKGEENHKFNKRACPKHINDMNWEADLFLTSIQVRR